MSEISEFFFWCSPLNSSAAVRGNFSSKFFCFYAKDTLGNAVIGKQQGQSTIGWRFALSSIEDEDVIFCGSGGSQQIQVGANPKPPTDGTLHHFGWTYSGNSDASGFTFYVDSVAVGKTVGLNNLTSASISNTEPLKLGRRGTSLAFTGILKHISVWNRELTSSEVSEVYGGGTPPDLSLLSFFDDCIGWWKIDLTDTTDEGGVIDHSASGNHGTAMNGLGPDTIIPSDTPVNLDGVYTIDTVTPNNTISLVDPASVNSDWDLLSVLESYGSEELGNVISTITRIPS